MKRTVQSAAIALLLGLQLWSCAEDKFTGEQFTNEAPTVWLASAPPEGTVTNYRLHLWWGGWDPDGEVAYYEYVITDNESGVFDPADTTSTPGDYKWKSVFASDSIFVFSADLIADSSAIDFDGGLANDGVHRAEEFRRSHTFFIRSVDEQGRRSDKPAYRSFTSRTLSPTVFVGIPSPSGFNPADVPPITTFRWNAKDYVGRLIEEQEPDSVRWMLLNIDGFNNDWDATLDYIRDHPDAPEWSKWHWYQAPDDSGKFWTSPPKDLGQYYFAVQAKDEAGAISPVFDIDRNLRRVRVSPRTGGPQFRVWNRYMGEVRTTSPNRAPVSLDLPANVPMEFEFQADASAYGGVVSGYRYGWDILDLSVDDQWEIDYTPFLSQNALAKSPPRTFFSGTHTFYVEVIDNSGFTSRVEVRINVIPFNFELPLLLVDDWDEKSLGLTATGGGLPSDSEHDAFWEDVLSSVDNWSPVTDVYELGVAGRTELPIQLMAQYKTIIWIANGSVSARSEAFLKDLIVFNDPRTQGGGKRFPPLVTLFMAAGGRVMLVGRNIMTMSIQEAVFSSPPPRYPFIFRYELTADQDGAYQDSRVGIEGVGDESFAYFDCCLNVLDLSYVGSTLAMRQGPIQQGRGCPVKGVRTNDRRTDGLRTCLPLDMTTGGGFPRMDLRPEVAANPTLFYHESRTALVCDLYNPIYFPTVTQCDIVSEYPPDRDCFQPIWGNGCLNTSSLVYDAPVAFWTGTHKDRVSEGSTPPARSVVWGFDAFFFNPDEVREAMRIILHTEWQLDEK